MSRLFIVSSNRTQWDIIDQVIEIKTVNHSRQIDQNSKLGTGCKDTPVTCNSIFFIFLNQRKAQRDQKIIIFSI
jgi:hypothetical protein